LKTAPAASGLGRHQQGDRALERADDVAQADLGGRAGEVVAAARPALRADDPRTFQVLEDLLQKAHGDELALGDLANLRGATVVVEGDVEQRAHPVAAFVRQLHATFMLWRMRRVKNARDGEERKDCSLPLAQALPLLVGERRGVAARLLVLRNEPARSWRGRRSRV
jgi:hypothetical protein